MRRRNIALVGVIFGSITFVSFIIVIAKYTHTSRSDDKTENDNTGTNTHEFPTTAKQDQIVVKATIKSSIPRITQLHQSSKENNNYWSVRHTTTDGSTKLKQSTPETTSDLETTTPANACDNRESTIRTMIDEEENTKTGKVAIFNLKAKPYYNKLQYVSYILLIICCSCQQYKLQSTNIDRLTY